MSADLPKSVPTTDVNKVCASGLKTVMMAAQSIRLGDTNVMVAGGMESMSKIPHYAYLRQPTIYAHATLVDGLMNDGLTDVYDQIPMGTCTEKVNSEMGITREM